MPFVQLVSGHFMQALGYSSMLLLPLYLGHLDASRATIGAVMGIAAVGGLLLRPMAGWALDRVGRRPTLIVGTLILVLGLFLIGFVTEIGPLVYGARILVGIGVGTLFTAYFTSATDLIPPSRRAEGIALFGVSGLAPLALNGVLGRVDIPADELRWVFPIVGLVVLASLLPIRALGETHRVEARSSDEQHIGRVLAARSLWSVWAATMVFSGLVAVFMTFVTVTALNRGVAQPADVWFTYAVGAIGVRVFGGRLPERVGLHNMVAPALATYIAACLLAASADTNVAFALAGLLGGLGHGYCFPVLTAQVVGRTPIKNRGSALAAFTGLWEISGLIMPPAFGLIADRSDDASMFALAAVAATIGLASWAALERGASVGSVGDTGHP